MLKLIMASSSALFALISSVLILAVFLQSDCDLALILLPFNPIRKFERKVVWITGASSGIGASLAKAFSKSGAIVVISARREKQLEEVSESCSHNGQKPFSLVLDVTDYDSHQKAVQQIISKFGRIDILVMNAGRSQRALALDTPLSETQELMNLNFLSYVALAKHVIPEMSKMGGGQVIGMPLYYAIYN